MKIPEPKRRRLQRLLGIDRVGGGGKYLGLPEQFGRRKVELFDYIVKRVKARTEDWSHKYLSQAGKEILIKSVAMALPVYSMNCFLLPITICDEITKSISAFWWGRENNRRKIPWVAWNRMCLPKSEGGLGFKDLHHFNTALLAKQAWRLLINPQSLLARLYKGLYHPNSTFLQSVIGHRTSYGWRSIQAGKNLLQLGLRVRMGNGKDTKIWTDPWLPTLPPRPAHGPILDPDMTVADLWKENKREWDPVVFEGVLNPEDQQLAQELYLSQHAEADTFEWAYTQNAQYSVRSGYWVATHVNLRDDEEVLPPHGSVALKQKLWKIKMAPKIQHFLWRCLSGALATATQLRTRQILADPICQRCCHAEETINHLIFTCPFAQAVWRSVNVGVGSQLSFSDDLENNIYLLVQNSKRHSLPLHHQLLPFRMMWRLWKSRNEFLFQKINRNPESEAGKGIHDVEDWLEATSILSIL